MIKLNPAHKGMLHEELGVKEGQTIPLSKIMAAKKSKNPALRKRATFAANARKFAK